MASDAMKTAQQLIKQQRYEEARALLRTLDNPLARAWLESLDGLGSGQGAPGFRHRRLVILVLMLALVAATIIIVLTRNYEQYTLAQETQRVLGFGDRRAELEAICEERGYTEEECTAWMLTQAMDVDLTPAPAVPPAPRDGVPPLPGRP